MAKKRDLRPVGDLFPLPSVPTSDEDVEQSTMYLKENGNAEDRLANLLSEYLDLASGGLPRRFVGVPFNQILPLLADISYEELQSVQPEKRRIAVKGLQLIAKLLIALDKFRAIKPIIGPFVQTAIDLGMTIQEMNVLGTGLGEDAVQTRRRNAGNRQNAVTSSQRAQLRKQDALNEMSALLKKNPNLNPASAAQLMEDQTIEDPVTGLMRPRWLGPSGKPLKARTFQDYFTVASREAKRRDDESAHFG